MTKSFFQRLALCLCLVLPISAAWAETQELQAALPDVGNGRIVVCGQNAYNYFVVDLDNGRSSYSTVSGLEDRTKRMVNSLRYMDADIYAFNELENNGDSVLSYLTIAMNNAAGKIIYAYVKDNCTKGNDSEQIKSGFVYRLDKVKPYGTNTATTSRSYYRNTMRYQAWEELLSGERFVLSVNHFKAKSGDDNGEQMRMNNASDLVSGLSRITIDPDILIVGDLNCTISEDPLQYLLNADYTEQLLRFSSSAYSYIYSGKQQLIDHVFANASMATQITGAGVYHVNTIQSWSSASKYSDHDPYLVALNLGNGSVTPDPDPEPGDCNITFTQDFKAGFGDFTAANMKGSADWLSDSRYGAKIKGYGKNGEMDNWLISPAFNLAGAERATLSFSHNIFYDNSNGKYADYQTLWYTTSYSDGDKPDETRWTQIAIPDYAVKSYIDCSLSIPAEFLQSNFRFAFRYTAPDGSNANYWEIENAALTSVCKADDTAIHQPMADFSLQDEGTRVFSIMGQEFTQQKGNLPAGIYILLNGNQARKIMIP